MLKEGGNRKNFGFPISREWKINLKSLNREMRVRISIKKRKYF